MAVSGLLVGSSVQNHHTHRVFSITSDSLRAFPGPLDGNFLNELQIMLPPNLTSCLLCYLTKESDLRRYIKDPSADVISGDWQKVKQSQNSTGVTLNIKKN